MISIRIPGFKSAPPMAFVRTAQVLPPPLAPPYAVYSVRLLKNSSCLGFACPGSHPISVRPVTLFCFAISSSPPEKKQKEPHGEGLRSSNARLQGLFRLTAQWLFVSSYNTPARRCLITISRGIPGFRSEELSPQRLRHNSTSTGILQPLPLHHSSSPFASAP